MLVIMIGSLPVGFLLGETETENQFDKHAKIHCAFLWGLKPFSGERK